MSAAASRSLGFGWPPLIGLALVLAVGAVGLVPPSREPPARVLATASLRMLAQPDGGLTVEDARDGAVLARIPGAGDNFVRGFAHAMSTIRARYRIDPATPYRLTDYSDGRLVFLDPATRSAIDIESFGPTNLRGFLALMPKGDGM